MSTIAQTIAATAARLSSHGVQNARLDAEVLLCHVLTRDRAWLLAHMQDRLDDQAARHLERIVDRRAVREPLQYITGRQEFWGLEFVVTPDVLIPRPETELVVEAAIRALRNLPSPLLVDLCTGSGCIAVSIAKELKSSRIFAVDQSEEALAVARKNSAAHDVSGRIRFLAGNLFQPIQELDIQGKVDVITANPPYIPSRDLPSLQPEVRDFEPEMALIAGTEGTEIHERIIKEAPLFLKKGGSLIMEMGVGQAERLIAVAETSGVFTTPEIQKDLAGIDRIIILQKGK
jgi:release factor glutamine methyltransferase